ncbi:MAG: tRNA lysidine(34) synthetase TilS [Holosporales bacterium]|jgi:tRNA(Ile)-lysidine synthase|nr:tRNA lysidine(34) synthetase TilS [Holosporales bacterium]
MRTSFDSKAHVKKNNSLLETPVGRTFIDAMKCVEHRMPLANTKIAVAVSGGSDSLALLLLAQAWSQRFGQKVIAFTVDHHLRKESTQEALSVQKYMQALDIPHEILQWFPPENLQHGHIEKVARTARYERLTEACWRHEARILLVGHTQNDQIETMLLRASRKSSDFGLAGMSVLRFLHPYLAVARPLLKVTRFDLQHFLKQNDVLWFADPSNENPAFKRVLLRKALLHVHREIYQDLVLVSRFYAIERRFYTIATIRFLKESACIIGMRIKIKIAPFKAASLPLQQHILRRIISCVGGKMYPPNKQQLSQACEKISSLECVQFTLGRTIIDKRKASFTIFREKRHIPPVVQLAPKDLICWDGRFWFYSIAVHPYWIYPQKGKTDPDFYKEGMTAKKNSFSLNMEGQSPSFPHNITYIAASIENIFKDW